MDKYHNGGGILIAEYYSPRIEIFNMETEGQLCQSIQQKDDMESFEIEGWY